MGLQVGFLRQSSVSSSVRCVKRDKASAVAGFLPNCSSFSNTNVLGATAEDDANHDEPDARHSHGADLFAEEQMAAERDENESEA